MYLKSIELVDTYRNLEAGLKFPLKDITLLVGDQGCGKSSLLGLLQRNDIDYIKVSLSEETLKKGVNFYFFDTEKNNPRTAPDSDYENPDGSTKGIGIIGKVASAFQSHGETLKQFTVDMIGSAENCVLLLDEPESALSVKNQYRLAKVFAEAVNNKCQIIAATHCIPLIESAEHVYDLEAKQWKESEVFLKEQKQTEIC